MTHAKAHFMPSRSLTGPDIAARVWVGRSLQTDADLILVADGAGIRGNRDGFHIAQRRVSGDFGMTACFIDTSLV